MMCNELPSIAHLVRDPVPVNIEIRPRLDAIDPSVVVLDRDVVPGGGQPVNGRCFSQVPDALLEEEFLGVEIFKYPSDKS